jgi:hypothetical protein
MASVASSAGDSATENVPPQTPPAQPTVTVAEKINKMLEKSARDG